MNRLQLACVTAPPWGAPNKCKTQRKSISHSCSAEEKAKCSFKTKKKNTLQTFLPKAILLKFCYYFVLCFHPRYFLILLGPLTWNETHIINHSPLLALSPARTHLLQQTWRYKINEANPILRYYFCVCAECYHWFTVLYSEKDMRGKAHFSMEGCN